MLSAQLKQQLKLIQTLQLTLEAETTCLKEKEFSQLDTILSEKQTSLQEIAKLDKVLTTTTAQEEIANNADLLTAKTEIENQLSVCQKINDLNGQLVELSMKSNKHLMQLIKQATGKNSVTYDQKGGLNSSTLLGKDIKA